MPEAMNLHKETIRALGREIRNVLDEQTRLCVAGNRAAAERLEAQVRELCNKRATEAAAGLQEHRSE